MDKAHLEERPEAKRSLDKTTAPKSPSSLSNSFDSMDVLVGTPTEVRVDNEAEAASLVSPS